MFNCHFVFVVRCLGNKLQREIRAKYIADDLSCKLCNTKGSHKHMCKHILFHTQIKNDGTPPVFNFAPDGTCLLCGFKCPTMTAKRSHIKKHMRNSTIVEHIFCIRKGSPMDRENDKESSHQGKLLPFENWQKFCDNAWNK